MKTFKYTVTVLCMVQFCASQGYDKEAYDYSDDRSNDDEEDSGFVTPLDFSPLFGAGIFGLNKGSEKSVFDVGGSESRQSGHNIFQEKGGKQFAPENFGFIPKFSQGIDSSPKPKQYQSKPLETNKPRTQAQFNIQTKHESYKKPAEIKVATYEDLVKNPKLYNPNYKVVQVPKNEDHLAPYKKYSFQPQPVPVSIPTYQAFSSDYSSGPFSQVHGVETKSFRFKRYTASQKNQQQEKTEEYYPYYNSGYKSKPKEFDTSYYTPDFSDFENNQKQYDYGGDDEYNFDEYERIKSISEQQATEAKKNPENCKEVKKNSMTCTVCQNPKNGGNYETCSYVSEPKNNKYAYVKEHKFDSNDDPEEQEESSKAELKQKPEPKKPIEPTSKPYRGTSRFQSSPSTQRPKPVQYKYYTRPQNAPIKEAEPKFAPYAQQTQQQEQYDDDYDFKSFQDGFFTNDEPKKNVEHVLAEFAKKDRSSCKKIYKNEMTCYQCTDKTGLKNEECMYVSESAPKTSHLAYQEIKEFNSKSTPESPEPTHIPTSTSTFQPTLKNKELYKKYTKGDQEKKILLNPRPVELSKAPIKRNVKRSSFENYMELSSDSMQIGNPRDFATHSRGAFWAETVPRYSRDLGVSLPHFMLTKSEHEAEFDHILARGI